MDKAQAVIGRFAEQFPSPPPAASEAADQGRAAGYRDLVPGEGGVLQLLARVAGARTAVTTTTVGGALPLWLLAGLPAAGALTCLDDDPAVALTRRACAAGSVAQHRWRAIPGDPTHLMTRLRDGNYDLVVIDAAGAELAEQVRHSRRLLRPGGLLVLLGAAMEGAVANPADRSEAVVFLRGLFDEWRSAGEAATFLPVGSGVVAAVMP